MSGIVGVFCRDGAPAPRGVVNGLTQFLSYVGPDAQNVWASGAVALGNAALRTTHESARESQPLTLDGRYTITADARIDAREELRKKLSERGRAVDASTTDAELILHAFAVWDAACVAHLAGDFVFAIWDAKTKRLFCARDHFGVKPFYYAEAGERFIFSNVLDCVRSAPGVPSDLNEAAVGDFLLFGLNCDLASTTFSAIRKLPPAHTLVASADGVRTECYWTPPTTGRIRYKNTKEYAEHFEEIFREAVRDRLRTDRVALLMSGGLDSATVAVTARDLLHGDRDKTELRGFTVVYESLFKDDEGGFARELANSLAIPLESIAVDALEPFEGWPAADGAASDLQATQRRLLPDGQPIAWPEPVDDPFLAGLFIQFGAIAKFGRVALSGDGSDNLMHFEMWPYAKQLAREGDWGRLARELPPYIRKRKSPLPGAVRRVKKAFGKDDIHLEFPEWVSKDFVARFQLKEREAEWRELPKSRPHPILPRGHASLGLPQWSHLFEMQNPGVTHFPVEMRHPFLDFRVANFLLALPPFPLYMEKKLLREMLAGRVPEGVRRRKKTPLAGNPLELHAARNESKFMKDVQWEKDIRAYVDTHKLEQALRMAMEKPKMESKMNRMEAVVRPICLNFWLRSMRGVRYNFRAEVRNG
jgi:asparagine synthase (glutamine-hydrolysing)